MLKKGQQKKIASTRKSTKNIPYFDKILEELNSRLGENSKVLGVLVKKISFGAGSTAHINNSGNSAINLNTTLDGVPYYGKDANSAEIIFVRNEKELLPPDVDEKLRRIKFYYLLSEVSAISSILMSSNYVLCAYYESPFIDQKGAYLYTYDSLSAVQVH